MTPFVDTMPADLREVTADQILATFASNEIQIAVKQQNTKAFLDAARERLLELENHANRVNA